MIDASIALGVKPPQIESPMNALAKVLQVREAQQGQQINALKMDEYQRGIESQNRLRQLLGGFGADHSANEQKLMQGGYMKEAQDYGKNQADIAKTTGDAQYKQIETAHKKIDLMGQAFGFVKDNPSAESALQATDYLVQNGIMTPEQAQATKAKIAADPSPETIRNLAMQAYQNALSTKDQLPKLQTFNAGNRQVNQAVNPITGKATETGSTVIGQSADNKASVGASYSNANATREVAKATRDAASIRANQDTEMKLGDDYRAQSKPFKEVSDAYRQITATLDKATTSPAATLAGATKFMKMLDPGSVVRESELGMALAASGVFDRAGNYVNTLRMGKVLTPTQVADFKNITKQIYKAAQDGQKMIDADYSGKAKTYGLRSDMIVQDLGQNAGEPEPPAPAAPKLPNGWAVRVN